ncbi:MAG: hypothetical protein JW913_00705 [Chitinispirillaceae bacterium]|nr:hypothetical protein [Chitinispirillaceae bacterium]
MVIDQANILYPVILVTGIIRVKSVQVRTVSCSFEKSFLIVALRQLPHATG